jgi:predicted translin family RNA/ssDNA-binding protein
MGHKGTEYLERYGYFSPSFEQMETCTLRLWLHEAQVQLPESTGVVRELLLQGIRDCAGELKYRWRQDMASINKRYAST